MGRDIGSVVSVCLDAVESDRGEWRGWGGGKIFNLPQANMRAATLQRARPKTARRNEPRDGDNLFGVVPLKGLVLCHKLPCVPERFAFGDAFMFSPLPLLKPFFFKMPASMNFETLRVQHQTSHTHACHAALLSPGLAQRWLCRWISDFLNNVRRPGLAFFCLASEKEKKKSAHINSAFFFSF